MHIISLKKKIVFWCLKLLNSPQWLKPLLHFCNFITHGGKYWQHLSCTALCLQISAGFLFSFIFLNSHKFDSGLLWISWLYGDSWLVPGLALDEDLHSEKMCWPPASKQTWPCCLISQVFCVCLCSRPIKQRCTDKKKRKKKKKQIHATEEFSTYSYTCLTASIRPALVIYSLKIAIS